ncbi:hypothetical protein ACFL2Z_01035 [Candidatus Eisenbacteria bacterium]|uniref:Lipoprotein n=1 Tax=Eiseniibacteriota bacterium TaxID=2212470 RepID=A0ABV6YN73_UNCEI
MKRRWLILLAVLIGIGLAGCYTMLSHPNVGMETAVHGGGHHCSECHTGNDYYYNNYPYYYDSYWRHPRWWSYYGSPWWYYDDWYSDDGDGGEQLPVDRSRYWDPRERPTDRPVVVPGATTGSGGGTSTPPATDDKKSTRAKNTDTKQPDDSGKAYWNRNTRPPKPPAEPEKPKTVEKKSEEKKTKERE